MKKITFLFTFLLTFGYSQNNVTIDDSAITGAFINVFNASDNSFAFNFEYNLPALKATFPTSSSIVLAPNFQIWADNDDTPCAETFCSVWNPSWFSSPMTPNKNVEAISFAENNALAGSDLNFSGTVSANTLDGGYTALAFIKTLDPNNGFATVTNNTVAIPASGDFTVSATAAELQSGLIIQYGFTVTGLIADPATEASLGSIQINSLVLSTNNLEVSNFRVSPNPSNTNWNISGLNTTLDKVEVYDLLGKTILVLEPNSEDVSIDASEFKAGIYLAKLSSNGASTTVRLIKN